ncbi:MAG: DUF434 domain-containing protein [Prolixibacteraceae bacterium]|nr:DUF434 domain-containing protein [Prolixibacteraceae bacterium]
MRNRGKESNDNRLFGSQWLPALKSAADDHGFLLTRGYGSKSALELVGNRYGLNKRQREAVLRISASEDEIIERQHKACALHELQQQTLAIDAFNLLIILESALSGACIFKGRDGAYRDIQSVHGSYKRVMQTGEAIKLAGESMNELQISKAIWYFDAPVSNSGRLKTFLMNIAGEEDYNWDAQLLNAPDKALAKSEFPVATSDGWIMDRCTHWVNLAGYIIEQKMKNVNLVNV